ncbi:hypothetical protein D3C84_1080490 [compost metagenome]
MADALLYHHVHPIHLFQHGAGEVVDLPWQIDHYPVIAGAGQLHKGIELLGLSILRQTQLSGPATQHMQGRAEVAAKTP